MKVVIDELTVGRHFGAVARVRVLSEPSEATGQPYFYTYAVGIRLTPKQEPEVLKHTPSMALPLAQLPESLVVFDFIIEEPGKFEGWPADEELRPLVAKELLAQYKGAFRRPG